MSELWIDIAASIVLAAIGMAGGLWLGTSSFRRLARGVRQQRRRLRKTLGQLHEIAASLSNDVTSHTGRMERINEELEDVRPNSPEVVLESISRLLVANRQLHDQLSDAQSKIEQQRTLIEVHASQASTDPLTGLANRRAFEQEVTRRCAEAVRYGNPVSLLMLDIDRFKAINDTYGHAAGDEVLVRVADALRRCAREADLPIRLGGEEFGILLPVTPMDGARIFAERVREAIAAERVLTAGQAIAFTASIGVAQYLRSEDHPAWAQRADAALYAAKRGGRNRSYWHDGATVHPVMPEEPAPTQAADDAEPAEPAPDPSTPAERTPHAHSLSLRGRTEFCMMLARRFAEWQRGGETPTVLLVRIDRFQRLAPGEDERSSDVLYQRIAGLLQSTLGDHVVVGLYNPGTLAVMLLGAGLQGAVGIAEWLRQAAVSVPSPGQQGLPRLAVSVGIAQPCKEDNITAVLRRAEEAVATATQQGGSRCFVHDGNAMGEVSIPGDRLASPAGPPEMPACISS